MINLPYIICAAILFKDGKTHPDQPENVLDGFVIGGRRHHNAFASAFVLHGKQNVMDNVKSDAWKIVDGFLTSDDRFVNRREASQIAFDAKQIDKQYELLISEHLY